MTRSKLAQLSSLVDKIDAKIVDLEARRDEVIDQRVAERLEGRPDASVKRVATLDAEVVIERAARDGAARALAAATERLQAIPELMRIERVKLAATAALRAELQWRQPHAVATRAAARYAAAQQMTGQIVQEVTLRPPAHMVAVAMRELETELFGAALPGDDSDSSCFRTRRHELLSRSR